MSTSYVNQIGKISLKKDADSKPLRLLCTPKPQLDESLMGYILRLTEENGYDTPLWIIDLGDGRSLTGYDKWTKIYRTDINFTNLERVLGLEHTDFETMRWRFNNTRNSVCLLDTQIPARLFSFHSPKICPSCLRQANYCRKVWDLLPCTACPIHESLLIDICPVCARRLAWERGKVSVCQCGYDWRDIEPQRVSKSELRVSWLLYQACGHSLENYPQCKKIHNALRDLMPEEICHALMFFADHNLITAARYVISADVPNIEWHPIFSSAYSMFDGWPLNFFAFVEQIRQQGKSTRLVREIHRSISSWCVPSTLFFIIIALEELIEKTLCEGSSDSSGWFPPNKRFINKEEVSRQLSLDQKWVDVLLKQRKLEVFKRSEDNADILIDGLSVCCLEDKLKQLIPDRDAARELRVELDDVLELIRYKCLAPLSGPSVDGFVEWKFDYLALKRLIREISSKTVKAKASHTDELIKFDDAIRYLKKHGLSIGRFIRAILDDMIIPQGELTGSGLSRFTFLRSQVVEYVKNPWPDRAERRMTLREVAEFLGTKWAENSLTHSNIGLEFHCPLTLAKVAKLLCFQPSVN